MDIVLIRHDGAFTQSAHNDWRSDVIEARVDGQPAGYIQMWYIPHDIVRERHPEAWKIFEKYRAAASQLPVGDRHGFGGSITPSHQEFDAFLTMIKDMRPFSLGWQPAEAIDKPCVSPITLYKPEYPYNEIKSWPEERKVNNEVPAKNYQKSGLGTLLYCEGARWMAERGMTLRGDVRQTPGALATWARLERLQPAAIKTELFRESWSEDVAEVKSEKVIDGSELKTIVPPLASRITVVDANEHGIVPDTKREIPIPSSSKFQDRNLLSNNWLTKS